MLFSNGEATPPCGVLSQNGLARLLKPLKIRPGTKHIAGEKTAKGYYLSDFEDAFRRYLAQESRFGPSHRHNMDEMAASQTSHSVTPESRSRKLLPAWGHKGLQ